MTPLHELALAMMISVLIFAGWAIIHTVRENWTRIKEALRGK